MEQAADVPATELQPEGGEPLPERGEPQPEGGELQPEGGEPQQDTEGEFQIVLTISRV